jgi:hypothetical protein
MCSICARQAVALGAVHRGVFEDPAQRPIIFRSGLPSAPFPDPIALGFPEVQSAIDHLEESASKLMAEMQEDITMCLEATPAPEGLQVPHPYARTPQS